MTLPTRMLDDRKFQDIVYEAKNRIKASCPEWTDHNVSDPGVTLIELFAWMTEMILYRLNQVPEKNYIKFMELLGLKLNEPRAARTPLTFYLSAPLPQAVVIPAGTEAATVRTETRPAVVFSTELNLAVHPPQLVGLFSRDAPAVADKDRVLVMQQLGIIPFLAFGKPVQTGSAFYFGFANDVSDHVLAIDVKCRTAGGIGIDPTRPPLQWEAFHGGEGDQRWLKAIVELDGTGGLSKDGLIQLRVPRMAQREYRNRRGAYWIRCRVINDQSGRNYDESPEILNIDVKAWGGTVWAKHASVVRSESLGRSDGSPGQIFQLEHAPLLGRELSETLEVEIPGADEWEPWVERPDFGESGPHDKHFTCDSTTGQVRFGPALREPTGRSHSYGAIPPRGARVRFAAYRYGGGTEGNVRAGELSVLKSSIPYVDRVCNYDDATGGLDAETIEMAKVRAPSLLLARGRAVTAIDYETLALAADSRVRRARCVPSHTAGKIYVLLVPQVERPAGRIGADQLAVTDDLRDPVQRKLDEHRLLTVVVDVRVPEYAWIAVDIEVVASRDSNAEGVLARVERRLYEFLNPIIGGAQGDGWPFGRALYVSDIYACLQQVRGIEFIESVRLERIEQNGTHTAITGRLELTDRMLIASAEHKVKVQYAK